MNRFAIINSKKNISGKFRLTSWSGANSIVLPTDIRLLIFAFTNSISLKDRVRKYHGVGRKGTDNIRDCKVEELKEV